MEVNILPDWSYHPIKNTLLRKLSTKHGRTLLLKSMNTIASLPAGSKLIDFFGHMKLQDVHQNEPHHSLVGLSGKIDPFLEGTIALQHLGFGFLEIGPVCFKIDESSCQSPFIRDDKIYFWLNGEKTSFQRLMKMLTNYTIQLPIYIRMDETENTPEILQYMIMALSPFVHGFFLTENQLHLIQPIKDVSYYKIISSSMDNLPTLNPAFIQGFIVDAPINIEQNFYCEDEEANERLVEKVKQLKLKHNNSQIITSGGVNSPEDGVRLLDAGAQFIMCTEGYVSSGPGLPKRINERLHYNFLHKSGQKLKPWLFSFLFGLSIFIAGWIAAYFAFTTVILPYDENFIGMTREILQSINPRVLLFMEHDRMSLAGSMISAGILYMALAYFGIRRNLHWAKIAFHSAAIVGFLGIILFIGYGYFDWLHGLFWLLLFPIYYGSWRETKHVDGNPSSRFGENSKLWLLGVYGQLMFVLLGGLLIIGGFVISIIGISTVFVSTDLLYICMSKEMLDNISNTLIPVIAHDRAGFGSALISVGLLVLCTALWGYREGERWLWITFFIGALPAFVAGVGTHFTIGYTSFIHLLPLYLLIIIYILGLVLSFPYLMKRQDI